eukprot:6185269-Pleurochrysis_carterae.AAC.5
MSVRVLACVLASVRACEHSGARVCVRASRVFMRVLVIQSVCLSSVFLYIDSSVGPYKHNRRLSLGQVPHAPWYIPYVARIPERP